MYEKGQYIVYGIRGVCQVADIITIDHPIGPKGRLYYELHPYNQKDGKIVTPVDSEKTITRLLLTRPEAEALIQEIPQIKEMTVANDKQREERYKEALKTCDLRVDENIPWEVEENGEKKLWMPHNANGGATLDTMSLKMAFAQSVNTIAANIAHEVGIQVGGQAVLGRQ